MNSLYFDQKPSFAETQVTQHGSHMVMTNVMKELKTKFISLDTKFAEDYHDLSTADCVFKLPERMTEIQSMAVSSVMLPLTFYNISAALQNNSMVLTFNNQVLTVVIPDGNYTLDGIIRALNQTLTSIFPSNNPVVFTETSSQNNQQNKCTFSFTPNTTTTSLLLRFNIDGSGQTNRFEFKSRLGWILGFRKPVYKFTTAGKITSEGLANLATVKTLFLVLDEFSTSAHSSSFHAFLSQSLLNKNILAQVAIDSTIPWGRFQYASLNNGLLVTDVRKYYGDRVDLQKCQVRLVNEFGRVMALNENDFSFVLELKHF